MENTNNSDKLNFYREYRDSFVKMKEIEERQSEQRIRFFIALVTGTFALIGIFDNATSNFADTFGIALFALVILSLYGLLTFSQIIWSSHVIHNLNVTRITLDDLIKDNEPVLKKRIEEADIRKEANIFFLKYLKGTFAQYMYLTEGLLIGGIIFLIGSKICQEKNVLNICIAVFSSIITIILMFIWGSSIKKGEKKINNKSSA